MTREHIDGKRIAYKILIGMLAEKKKHCKGLSLNDRLNLLLEWIMRKWDVRK
jgi:hypothetical protein